MVVFGDCCTASFHCSSPLCCVSIFEQLEQQKQHKCSVLRWPTTCGWWREVAEKEEWRQQCLWHTSTVWWCHCFVWIAFKFKTRKKVSVAFCLDSDNLQLLIFNFLCPLSTFKPSLKSVRKTKSKLHTSLLQKSGFWGWGLSELEIKLFLRRIVFETNPKNIKITLSKIICIMLNNLLKLKNSCLNMTNNYLSIC